MEEGSFDDAVMACEGVFHVASPVIFIPRSDPKAELIDPAVKWTLNVLRSCKNNPMLKKVVLTSSSVGAIYRPSIFPKEPLNETSWSSMVECEKIKAWYAVSKVVAEKAMGLLREEQHQPHNCSSVLCHCSNSTVQLE